MNGGIDIKIGNNILPKNATRKSLFLVVSAVFLSTRAILKHVGRQ